MVNGERKGERERERETPLEGIQSIRPRLCFERFLKCPFSYGG